MSLRKLIKGAYNVTGTVASIIAGILLLLSAYSHVVSPEKVYYATYLSLAFPIFLALNIALLIFWAIQYSKIFFITLTVLILSASNILIYSPIHVIKAKTTSDDTISVLTYNVHLFSRLAPHTKDSLNPVIEEIKRENADIVCLQEYTYASVDNSLRQNDIDTAFAKIYPYKKVFLKDISFSLSGIACLSKYPIKSSQDLFPEKKNIGAALYKIDVKGRELSVIVVHLESNKLMPADRDLYSYIATHPENTSSDMIEEAKKRLTRKVVAAAKQRALQADSIALEIKSLGENILVCGDFNDTPQSYTYWKIKGDLNDAYVKTGLGPGITYNENMFYFRIDHILCGKALTPVYTKIGKTKGSDHYPVKAVLEWR